MLEVKDLTVAYGKHRALEGVSIRVRPGEIVVILGANGAGKSTLLKAVSGVCEGQVRGEVIMDGDNIRGLPPHKVVERGIALVPEGRGIFGDMTVRENLRLGANPARARDEADANMERLLRLFPKLGERAGQVARTMSGGEQQMVAVGRAMMSNPSILMLDEPSLGLSPLLCKELFQNLTAVRKAGLGILLVEQNARQSLAIADRGYLLENAQIVHEDKAEALMKDPAVQAAYLGGGTSSGPVAAAAARPPAAAMAQEASDAAPADMPPALRPRRRTTTVAGADELAGTDIAALVSRAAERSQPRTAGAPDKRDPSGRATPDGDRLRATLTEIGRAAADARSRVSEHPLPPLRPLASRATVTAAQPATTPSDDRPPPVIEIYRAPRVEIWRRRPGTSEYHRKEP